MMPSDTLILSVRELRLILERLVQAAGTPGGLLHSVRDCAFYSAVLPGPGLAGIAQQIEHLRASRIAPLDDVGSGETLTIDCVGQHAWTVAETLLDLAAERFRLTGKGAVLALNLTEAAELRVVCGLAERFGLTADIEPKGDGVQISVAARPSAMRSTIDMVRRDGFAAAASSWWPLYHASHDALMPDSFESRRHAGTVRVEADGRVIGRNDEDETDLSMLTADPSRLHATPVSSAS